MFLPWCFAEPTKLVIGNVCLRIHIFLIPRGPCACAKIVKKLDTRTQLLGILLVKVNNMDEENHLIGPRILNKK